MEEKEKAEGMQILLLVLTSISGFNEEECPRMSKEGVDLSFLTISSPPKGYQVSLRSGIYKLFPPFPSEQGQVSFVDTEPEPEQQQPQPRYKERPRQGKEGRKGESLALRPPTSLETTPAARKARIRTGGNTLTLVNNNVEDGPLGMLLNADVPFRAASVVC